MENLSKEFLELIVSGKEYPVVGWEYASMASELLRLREQELWRSMETAPKDGTSILVKERGDVHKVRWEQDYAVVCREDSPWRWCIAESYQDEQGGFSIVEKPEGWQPLPPAPERGE